MPEGFEKSVPPEGLADLLQFLTQKGKYLPLDLRKVATLTTTEGMPFGPEGAVGRLIFEDWGPKVVEGVPFALVDPQGDRQPNAIMLSGPSGRLATEDAEVGHPAGERPGQGDPPAERRGRPGIPGRPRGDRLDDRPHPV